MEEDAEKGEKIFLLKTKEGEECFEEGVAVVDCGKVWSEILGV